MTLRVVVADDHELFRDGLSRLIASRPGLHVVGEAGTTEELLQVVASQQPDLLTLDVELDHCPISRTIKIVRRLVPNIRIAILTMHTDRILRDQTLSAGASLFLNKGSTGQELLEALCSARRDGEPIQEASSAASGITPREREVLDLLSRAYSNREIAEWLSITEGTVKRHTGNIYEKLGARSRMDAVAKARLLHIL